ncbi:MAG: lipoate--protein ligase [Firmicutes bacterium]|nr:lipoate--protein ligase [Bacillota bacterium]
MQFTTRVVRSHSFDPWFNLALEEHLLRSVADKAQVILYLWQNKHTVVIGRNQNAWKQCRCTLLEEEGGKLARRLSGGGAVYHDLGNLNFTFVMSRSFYNLEKQLAVILDAVKRQGIAARFSGRNDLTAEGRKFSGNAFYFKENMAYHHGTLLVDVNVEDMVKYLQVSEEKMRSKAVESVRSRVVNLKSLNPELTIEKMAESVHAAFNEAYGAAESVEEFDPQSIDLSELYEKYASWDWRLGSTPKFDVDFSTRFPWGEIEVGLVVHKGHIKSARFFSDAMNSQLIMDISPLLAGAPLQAEAVSSRLVLPELAEEDQVILNDIRGWLQEKITNL